MTDVEIGSIWKHRKGAEYRVLGFCTLEATEERAVLYRLNRISGDFSDGEFVWCRPLSEFTDGRFKWIANAPTREAV
jgi:hypothetical protein